MAAPRSPEEGGGMFAASFDVRHDCPVSRISQELPDLRILHWCVNNRDVFQLTGPAETVATFQEWVATVSRLRHASRTPEGALLITSRCMCDDGDGETILAVVEEVGAWDIPPIAYTEGWESWRVIAWDDRSVRELFRRIRGRAELRITSLRPVDNVQMEKMMLVPASDLFAGVTARQTAALLLGLEYGYYNLPSETSIDRLAEGVGVSPSTYAEHLRKAETRILRNLRPYLETYATSAPGEVALAEVRPAGTTRRRTATLAAEAFG